MNDFKSKVNRNFRQKNGIRLLSLILVFLSLPSISSAETREDVAKKVIYYLLVDRFANGISDNDYANSGDPDAARHWPNTSAYGFPGNKVGNLSYDYAGLGEPNDLVNWKKFWGGDLQGVLNHADYFEKLAVGMVYISSPVKQSEAMPYYVDENEAEYPYTAYHGFRPRIFTGSMSILLAQQGGKKQRKERKVALKVGMLLES